MKKETIIVGFLMAGALWSAVRDERHPDPVVVPYVHARDGVRTLVSGSLNGAEGSTHTLMIHGVNLDRWQ